MWDEGEQKEREKTKKDEKGMDYMFGRRNLKRSKETSLFCPHSSSFLFKYDHHMEKVKMFRCQKKLSTDHQKHFVWQKGSGYCQIVEKGKHFPLNFTKEISNWKLIFYQNDTESFWSFTMLFFHVFISTGKNGGTRRNFINIFWEAQPAFLLWISSLLPFFHARLILGTMWL